MGETLASPWQDKRTATRQRGRCTPFSWLRNALLQIVKVAKVLRSSRRLLVHLEIIQAKNVDGQIVQMRDRSPWVSVFEAQPRNLRQDLQTHGHNAKPKNPTGLHEQMRRNSLRRESKSDQNAGELLSVF